MLALVAGIAIALGALAWVLWPVLRPGPVHVLETPVVEREPAAQVQVVCPTCGPRPEPDARVCSTCGSVLGE